MKLKIRIKWYANVGDYMFNRSIINTEIVIMDTTTLTDYMEKHMVKTGYIPVAEYIG